MGWTDSHLHEFTIGKKRYTEYPESKEDGLVCGRYRLGDLIKQKGRIFLVICMISVTAGSMNLFSRKAAISIRNLRTELACLEGERACPPEDVGGVPGYFEFCNALKDPAMKSTKVTWNGPVAI
jgi:hypothetical protein